MIKKFNQFITERFSLQNDFGITYQDLREILYHITDEFPKLEYDVEDSLQSSLIEKDDNCFIVTFNQKDINFPIDLPVLHYVEPKIFELINDVNAHLKEFNLYVYTSDFGQTDAYYELVISKIGHTPKDTTKRW
jgi:hypothetical protein